jgi:hypothetical protein
MARRKEFFNPRQGGRVQHKFSPQHLRDAIPRQVVAGGAKPARRDDQIRPLQSLARRGLDLPALVGDTHLA